MWKNTNRILPYLKIYVRLHGVLLFNNTICYDIYEIGGAL